MKNEDLKINVLMNKIVVYLAEDIHLAQCTSCKGFIGWRANERMCTCVMNMMRIREICNEAMLCKYQK